VTTSDGGPVPGARAWGEPAPGTPDRTDDGPAARLRPASRASRTPRTMASRALRTASGRLRRAPAPLPDGVRVVEDHHLAPAERARAWQELVDWVIWLHAAYELSSEDRLPDCWPAHPGLVGELAALKAWRTEIYLPPPEATARTGTAPTTTGNPRTGNGGPARAWHTELRNVLTAAATVYAPGCRAGHRAAPRQLTGDHDARDAWLAQAPALVAPRGARPPGPAWRGRPRTVDGPDLERALRQGQARGLGPGLPGYARHEGTWWVHDPEGTWLAVTDPALAVRLDQAAATWDRAQTAVTRREQAP
jgi:hypothetical protein